MEVDLGGLDGFVSQSEGDHRLIDPVLQQLHRRAVPEDVRADPHRRLRHARSQRGKGAARGHSMRSRLRFWPSQPRGGEGPEMAPSGLKETIVLWSVV